MYLLLRGFHVGGLPGNLMNFDSLFIFFDKEILKDTVGTVV
jgi:hypothetical protein